MSKIIAAITLALFAATSTAVFAADEMKKDDKKGEMKKDDKKADKKDDKKDGMKKDDKK